MLTIKKLAIKFYNREEKTWLEAVHNISFSLQKGKVLGIVGESGSGKSVTSFAIMRLHDSKNTAISGQIIFNDTDILKLAEKEMTAFRGDKVAMIFQEPMTSLNPVFTCGYQVQEAIMLHQKVDISSMMMR